jgi:poly(hydroxyalkanoate) depolymerase family esterase
MRWGRFAVLFLLVSALVAAVPAAAEAKRAKPVSTSESWTFVPGGARDYWLYVPAGTVPRAGRPLVMYLHGCTQNNATDPPVAFGTRWNELAAKVGAVLLYPLQAAYDMGDPAAVEGNGASCWNWFLDKNMHRGAGEPAILAELAQRVAAGNHVDRTRMYAMGVSAGADMTDILSVTYPDVFRATAMFAGCAYGACRDVTGRESAAELARYGLHPTPSIIFQGDGDTLNNVAMGETLLRQQVGMRGLGPSPTSTENHGDPLAVNPGTGNACAGPHANWPCVAGVTGWSSYPYTVDHYDDATGRAVVDRWLIHGLNHDYPNGDYRSTFTDPAGPDITTAAWNFFVAAK